MSVVNSEAIVQLSASHDYITVSWQTPEKQCDGSLNPSIAGYNIYRTTTQGRGYVRLNKELIRVTSYQDTDLKLETEYYYVVTAVDTDNRESSYSAEVKGKPGLIPPCGLEAIGGKSQVELTWDAYTGLPIRGYNLYRGESTGGPYHKINEQLPASVGYVDTALTNEKNYYYVLSVVDRNEKESLYSSEVGATTFGLSLDEIRELEKIEGLKASLSDAGIVLSWQSSAAPNVVGYNVYRRDTAVGGEYGMLNTTLLQTTTYLDDTAISGKPYYYTVAAVNSDGYEALFPLEIRVDFAVFAIVSVVEDTEGTPRKAGETITVTLTGTTGETATFDIEGVVTGHAMQETEDQEGTYFGTYVVEDGINVTGAGITGRLSDQVTKPCKTFITIDSTSPPVVTGLDVNTMVVKVNGDMVFEVEGDIQPLRVPPQLAWITWEMPQEITDVDHYRLYRSATNISAVSNSILLTDELDQNTTFFTDGTCKPDRTYYYALATVDAAGNESVLSEVVQIAMGEWSGFPEIKLVEVTSLPGVKKLGDVISVRMTGEPACEGSFCICDSIGDQSMTEEPSGTYTGRYTVKAGDNATDVLVTFKLVDEPSRSVSYKSAVQAVSVFTGPADTTPPEIEGIDFHVPYVSRREKVVTGDILKVTITGEQGARAYFNIGGYVHTDGTIEIDWTNQVPPLDAPDVYRYNIYQAERPFIFREDGSFLYIDEDEPRDIRDLTLVDRVSSMTTTYHFTQMESGALPCFAVTAVDRDGKEQVILTPRFAIPVKKTATAGQYLAEYEIETSMFLENGYVSGYMIDQAGNYSEIIHTEDYLTIDTSTHLEVICDPTTVPADSKSKANVEVVVTNARGRYVEEREVELKMFTTEEYTGIVGVGVFEQDEYGELRTLFRSKTDMRGTVQASYTAGFAAKTVIIRAQDKVTGQVAANYITSFINETVSIELAPVLGRISAGNFFMTLTAEPDHLTADGVSRSKITATVKDATGKPVAGHRISFSITDGPGGRLNTTQPVTDADGKAFAIYTAAKKIGTVEITAVDTTAGISAKVYIILMSDAPAKIELTATPAKLPADGHSTALIEALVSDINNNPNRGTLVEFSIISGQGSLSSKSETTDFLGKAKTTFTAGTEPGTVVINARVTSKVPSAEEMEKVLQDKGDLF